jgi:hypothetical protein
MNFTILATKIIRLLCLVEVFLGCTAFGQTANVGNTINSVTVGNDRELFGESASLIFNQAKSMPSVSPERIKFLQDLAASSVKELKGKICAQNSIAGALQFNPDDFKLEYDTGSSRTDQFQYFYSIQKGIKMETSANPSSGVARYMTYPTGSFEIIASISRNIVSFNPTRSYNLGTLMPHNIFQFSVRFELGTANPDLENTFYQMFDATVLEFLVQAGMTKSDIMRLYPQLAYLASKLPGSGYTAPTTPQPPASKVIPAQ